MITFQLRKAIEDTNSGCPPGSAHFEDTQTQSPAESKTLLHQERDRRNSDTTSVNSALTDSNV